MCSTRLVGVVDPSDFGNEREEGKEEDITGRNREMMDVFERLLSFIV